MAEPVSLEELEARIHEVSLDLDAETMRRAGYRVVDYLVKRLAEIRSSKLGRELTREETEELLREPMPEEPAGFDAVFDEYASNVAPNAIQIDHPQFFAFIPSAPSFVGMLADALVAGTNVFAGTWLESSGPSQVEILVIDWFKEMLGLPAEAAGLLVSGGSVANLTALAVARHAVLGDETADAVVYFSDQTHASVDRALRLLGIHPSQLRRIPTGPDLALDVTELRKRLVLDRKAGLRPLAVIANAGTTNTGAIDPLAEIAGLAREQELWLHVDAAYGGFAALTTRGRRLPDGIEQADSVVLDPHKWFYCPFEAGCVIVRRGRLMRETFHILPEYMTDVAREEREVNFCDYGVQLTRNFRALKVWMAVKTFGARRIREVIDQCLDLTEYAAELFRRSPHLEIVTPPSLGVFTFRYIPERLRSTGTEAETELNRLNLDLVARAMASREIFLSSTRLGSRTVVRFCVLNHRTRKADIRQALRQVERFGREADQALR
ncbi:MAG: aminotransferase class I/II-fold pyridoxal phosphate-dependent enzyme [Acidobacteriia bacterium]|nr:aminotransferase class I/II-fold pyridoxal phosphate-dependent enzyme [Terriglobia bacterium]